MCTVRVCGRPQTDHTLFAKQSEQATRVAGGEVAFLEAKCPCGVQTFVPVGMFSPQRDGYPSVAVTQLSEVPQSLRRTDKECGIAPHKHAYVAKRQEGEAADAAKPSYLMAMCPCGVETVLPLDRFTDQGDGYSKVAVVWDDEGMSQPWTDRQMHEGVFVESEEAVEARRSKAVLA